MSCLVSRVARIGLVALLAAPAANAFSPGRAGFEVRVRGETISLEVMAIFALPGETLEIGLVSATAGEDFRLQAAAGEVSRDAPENWRWQAPVEAGVYPLHLSRLATGEAMTLNVFVLVPYGEVEGGSLGRYEIGAYPAMPFRGLPEYRPPRGFVKVSRENLDVRLSPHFTLRQFVCKQVGEFPKYVTLRERLLLKLERLLEELNAGGHTAETFFIMSGYRTPAYNRAIHNVSNSRHIYGDAADIFVDEDGNSRMDDLTGDGRVDLEDVDVLRRIVENMTDKPWYGPFSGGLGRYDAKPHRGPFLHVDTRGYRARW